MQSLDDEREKRKDQHTSKLLKRAMGSVESLSFSPDGSLLAMCGATMRYLTADGLWLMILDDPGRLKVWDVKTGTLKHDLPGYFWADSVAFSPDGNMLASAGGSGSGVIIWNPHTGKQIRTIEQKNSSLPAGRKTTRESCGRI